MNLKECENNIIFNKKVLSINNCIRDATLVDLKECEPPKNVIINIKENCITNKKIDIDKLFILTNEKKSLNTMLAIEESDFSLWRKFINENQNKIKNLIEIKNEEKFLKNTIEINNNNITILKKTKIKLLFGLGLLIASDLLLKTVFC